VGKAVLYLIVLIGLAGAAIFGYFALKDWALLKAAYREFDTVALNSTDMPSLFVAEARQNIHRINLSADGVWTLLSAILAAIGLHGLCTRHNTVKQETR
jgi:ABC-type anion transport system duplicated permease subunit